MTTDHTAALKAAFASFDPAEVGTLTDHEPISMGLIHQTHRVATSMGVFCFQRLHPKLATDGILADYEAVLSHLASRAFPAPRLCLTHDGQRFFQDEDGHRWRATTWCDGQATSTIRDEAMIRSAAALLGRFHTTMEDIEYKFQSTHPLHDTPHHLQSLKDAMATHQSSEWLPKIQSAAEEVIATLPSLMLDNALPKRVVHGDPKISNVLFDNQWQATAMIDLDTCTRHSVLVDIGDAIRSWCRDGGEDLVRPFSQERFTALLEGYASTAPALTADEIDRLPHAGRLITLELTARFLADVLNADYFAWDANKYSSRSEHNWARAQSMLALAREMEAATPSMEAFVSSLFTTQT